jgi:hypothetical protein
MLRHLTIVEMILRERELFLASIRDCDRLWYKITAMLVSCAVFLAIYGAVMGGAHSIFQSGVSMIKLPFLFIVTLLICSPSLYFFNLLFGSRQTLPQMIALILTATTVTAVLLLGLAPISFFFLITSSEYEFFKLLNVAFFAIASSLGVLFLNHGMNMISDPTKERNIRTRRLFFGLWIVLYAFVGSQMAWTLSPFMSDPRTPFLLFTAPGGNFYADVLNAIRQLVGR